MFRAVILKQILWPQKQEDRDEGGWQSEVLKDQRRDAERPANQGDPEQIDLEPVII